MSWIGIILLIVAVGALYAWYPPLGGRTKSGTYKRSPQYRRRKFVNDTPTTLNFDAGGMWSLARQELGTHPHRKPSRPLAIQQPDYQRFSTSDKPQLVWLGHSSFLMRIGGKTILLDPMLSKRPSPVWGIGPARFSGEPQITVEQLPDIDAVIISHDHYDHLDYASIRKLRTKTRHFFVPLGLGAHLRKWDVPAGNISELDWWDETTFEGLKLACTPSRHFSGRALTDRYATLWASWAISASDYSVYFSGDSGYGPHFKAIGDKYGPFDLTILECGQYDALWPDVHMMPEHTAQAHQDLRGKRMVPMHWGAFVLSLHDWTDPIERVLKAGKKHGAKVLTPQIGEILALTSSKTKTTHWWRSYTS
jgi:L-ascorbate metabolism protein UlaG (beta-lactamase superfamily)